MSHCQGCPFMGCHDCAYKGGVDPNAPVAQRDSGATRRAKRRSTCDNRGEPLKRPSNGAGNTAEGLAPARLQGMSKEEPVRNPKVSPTLSVARNNTRNGSVR